MALPIADLVDKFRMDEEVERINQMIQQSYMIDPNRMLSGKPVAPVDFSSLCQLFEEQVLQKHRAPSEAARALGMNYLGNGHFSTVFMCPWDTSKVVKLGTGPSGDGDIYGDGWVQYAVACMKSKLDGTHNPLMADVHSLYIAEKRNWFLAVIDRYHCEWDGFCESKLAKSRWLAIKMGLQDHIPDEDQEYDKEYLHFAIALKSKLRCRADDLHNGNIMVEGDRVIVTDPIGRSHNKSRLLQNLERLGILPHGEEERIRTERERSRVRIDLAGIQRIHDELVMAPCPPMFWVDEMGLNEWHGIKLKKIKYIPEGGTFEAKRNLGWKANFLGVKDINPHGKVKAKR